MLTVCRNGFGKRVFALLFQCASKMQQTVFIGRFSGKYIRDGRRAVCNCSRFIQGDNFGFTRLLQSRGGFKQCPVFCPLAVADHHSHRRRQPQGTRATDNQNRNPSGERKSDALPHTQPYNDCQDGNPDYNRYKNSGNAVCRFRNRCFGCGGIADHLNDLGKCRVRANPRGTALQKSRLIDRCGSYGIADRFIHRDAFTGQSRFVHSAVAVKHNAVYGDAFTGAYRKNITDFHLLNRHGHFSAVLQKNCRFRCQPHQAFQRVGGFAFCA